MNSTNTEALTQSMLPPLPMLTIDEQQIPWEQVFAYMKLFGKLEPFLREFVSQYVLMKEIAARDDLKVESSELMQAIMDFRLAQKLESPDKFEAWLKRENLNNSSFQNRILIGLKVKKLREQIAAPGLEKFFEENQSSFEEILLSGLIATDQSLATELKDQVAQSDADLEALAGKYAVAEDKKARFFKQSVQRRSLNPKSRQLLETASEGEWVGPLELDGGWGIFCIESITPASLDEKSKSQIEAQLFGQWLIEKLSGLDVGFTGIPENTENA